MDRKLMMKKLSKSKFFYVVCILTLSIVSAFCVYAASISFYRVEYLQKSVILQKCLCQQLEFILALLGI